MRSILSSTILVLSLFSSLVFPSSLPPAAQKAYHNVMKRLEKRSDSDACNKGNVVIRKEWRAMSKPERRNYIAAVKCLQSTPGLLSSPERPGIVHRADDFTAIHINQTQIIHYTAIFNTWHRYYLHLYEKALRSECGYQGYTPYWEYSLDSQRDPSESPLFDGSDTSLGGNGEYANITNATINIGGNGAPDFFIPRGTGQGCVTTGPFANLTITLGPIANPYNPTPQPHANLFTSTPRCLTRDLNPYIFNRWLNWTVFDTLLASPDISTFQLNMSPRPGAGELGLHGGGHFGISGDPGADVFVSPADPHFYLHHGNIDRTWWIWQNLRWEERKDAISGTSTFLNVPPSAEMTLEDRMDWGGLDGGRGRSIAELLSTVDGPFCYVYA